MYKINIPQNGDFFIFNLIQKKFEDWNVNIFLKIFYNKNIWTGLAVAIISNDVSTERFRTVLLAGTKLDENAVPVRICFVLSNSDLKKPYHGRDSLLRLNMFKPCLK